MKATDNTFPCNDTNYTGLEARDYIAIQAMTGLCANPGLNEYTLDSIADLAYKQADALIKRSEAKDE